MKSLKGTILKANKEFRFLGKEPTDVLGRLSCKGSITEVSTQLLDFVKEIHLKGYNYMAFLITVQGYFCDMVIDAWNAGHKNDASYEAAVAWRMEAEAISLLYDSEDGDVRANHRECRMRIDESFKYARLL